MGKKHNLKFAAFVIVIVLALHGTASAGLVEPDGHKRTRIAECVNDSPAQMLLLQFDSPLREIGATPPAWQTLPSDTPQDYEALNDVLVIGAYDMIITGDPDYAQSLVERGIVRKTVPVWKERIILVGPMGREDMKGLPAAEIMRRVFSGDELFFSLLMDKSVMDAESVLWKASGIEYPHEGKGYVETGRDSVSALMQVGDERGFTLIGEASFSLYLDSERFEPSIEKLADTEYFKTGMVCLTENSGFRKFRTADAEKYIDWFASPEAEKVISSFFIGGTAAYSQAK
jgi:ABC-type tungstate transport system permease subunit